MGAEDHFKGEFKDGDFPRVVNAFDDGEGRITGFTDAFKDSFTDGIHGVVDNFLVHVTPAELETILKESKVLAFRAKSLDELIESGAGGRIKAF